MKIAVGQVTCGASAQRLFHSYVSERVPQILGKTYFYLFCHWLARCTLLYFGSSSSPLIHSQNSSTSLLGRSLLLRALIERHCALMTSPKVVQRFDLVKSNDPVFRGECLLDIVQFWSFSGHPRTTNAILGLSGREEGVVAIVRHLVPVDVVSKSHSSEKWL